MLYRDITFMDKNYNLIYGDIEVENGIVTAITQKAEGKGNAILPPFIDIHIHGGYGVDIMNSSSSEINFLSKKLYENNVGAYMPTTVAKSYSKILASAREIKYASLNKEYAEIIGLHIEGPFISQQYKGIMEDKYIVPCDIKLYEDIKNIVGDLKIRFTIAAECDGAEEFCKYVTSKGDFVSIGHSNATYNECKSLVKLGASSYTHLFNAMSPIHHRNIGVAGSGLLDDSFVEVISDFVHLSKECISLITKVKEDKIILITDAMEAMGCGNGDYIFCGKNVVSDGVSVRDDTGRLAGSVLTMNKAVSNMAKIVGLKSAIKMAAENPAKLLKLDNYGYIDIGRRLII